MKIANHGLAALGGVLDISSGSCASYMTTYEWYGNTGLRWWKSGVWVSELEVNGICLNNRKPDRSSL
jgi:hypothetical protein